MQSADCLTKVSFPFTCYLPLAYPLTSALSIALHFFVAGSPAYSPVDVCHMCIRFTMQRVMQFLLKCALSLFAVSFEIMHNCTRNRPVVVVLFFHCDCTNFICSSPLPQFLHVFLPSIKEKSSHRSHLVLLHFPRPARFL